ncbi:MAG TPA: hypothetical protein VM096_10070 [Vicinamibacterales bacterium]|nr:hypothetical protein [Vicinamibacterales bacterium]
MRLTLIVHVISGALGLLTGYVALAASKGAPLHRKAGMFFVYLMVTMSITGLLVSAVRRAAPAINIPSALLTFYLVITGLTSVAAPQGWSRRFDVAAMVMGVAIGIGCVVLAASAIGQGGAAAGVAYPLVMFGAAALMAGNGDRRILRDGPLKGAPRLKRHLWRMCVALLVPSIAFYLGPNRLPEALRIPALRAAGVMLPIVVIAYWKWRLRARRRAEIVHLSVPEVV